MPILQDCAEYRNHRWDYRLVSTMLQSSSSTDRMGQRTLTWMVQTASKRRSETPTILPLFWKFTPSRKNTCLISYSFTIDSLPTSTCKGPVSHRFKHYHGILVPYCLQEIWAICRKHSYSFPSSSSSTPTSCCSTRTSATQRIQKINAPKDTKITSPNTVKGRGRSHCYPECTDEGGAAGALPIHWRSLSQPRSSHHLGGLGKLDRLCLEEVSTPIIPPALERRWSNCWHRSNRKQLGISKVSTSTGCRWTTAKFIYWNDLSSFVSFSPGLRYARRYPGYSISSIPAKGEAKHPIPSPSAAPPTQPPKIPS